MPHKLTIAGYYGFRNAGDEAILSGMLYQLRQQIPDAKICVVSADPAYTRSVHNVDALGMEDLDALIEQVRRSDAVVLGGGGLLHDYWSLKEEHLLTIKHVGLAYYLGIILLAYLFDRPTMLFAVGVGPLADLETKDVIRWILAMVDRVTVRDPVSAKHLNNLVLEKREAREEPFIAADPAFDLPLVQFDNAKAVLDENELDKGPLLAVILRYWEYGIPPDVWQREVAKMLDQWIKQHSGSVVFLPFQTLKGTLYEDDSRVCRRVILEMENAHKAKILDLSEDFTLLPDVLSHCDVTLSMRLHGVIFSLLAATPVASMAYDPKIDVLMSMAGLEEFNLPRDEWEAGKLSGVLNAASSKDLRDKFNSFVIDSQLKSKISIQNLMELLEETKTPLSYVDQKLRDFTLQKVQAVITRQSEEHNLEYSTYRLADLFLRSQELILEMEASRATLKHKLDVSLDELERRSQEKTELQDRVENYDQQIQDQNNQIQELGARLSEQENQVLRLEALRDQLILDLDEANSQLSQLRDTLAVRISARYWALAKRMVPIGSTRRRIYRQLRSWLRRLILDQEPSFPSNDPVLDGESYSDHSMAGQFDRPGQVDEAKLSNSIAYFAEQQFDSGQRNVMTIFSPTPFVESDGQRAIHLAKEFLKKDFVIVFAYWRWDRNVRRQQDRLDEGIFQIPIDELIQARDELTRAFESYDEKVVLIEFPYPGLFESLAIAHAAGWVVVYDVVDDWEAFHQVGQADWFEKSFEIHLLSTADVVLTINEHLAAKVIELGRDSLAIVPNGVSKDFGQVSDPIVLERGKATLGYFGYLSPAWFNWELVVDTAKQNPDWMIYLIGYGDEGKGTSLPPNLIYLGKKPWRSLAAYALNWDVALVPFKAGPVAKAADPIKTYEYLSLGLPVVLTGVDPPHGAERLVFKSANYVEFIDHIHTAVATADQHFVERKEFAWKCEWSNRAQLLGTIIAEGRQRVGEKRELFCHLT